jgi:signal transduction histidine kinase
LQWVSDFATPLASVPLPVAQDEEVLKPLLQQQVCVLLVADLPAGPLKIQFQAQAVKSLLLLPVCVHDQSYGCLAIADCQQARSWETETINFLNTIALNLAKAIALQNTALQLQQSLREQNNILESISDGFLALDKNWDVRYLNQMGEQLLLISREQALNKNIWDLFADAVDTPFYTHYHQAMHTQMPVHFEAFYATLDKWFDVSAYPSPTILTVYFRDVTARKQQEDDLKALNVRLQKHIKALATSNQELEQFAYVASHDLQEPLRMVTSFLSQIEKKYAPVLDDKGRQYIYFAVDGAKRMRQIILDLLNFSRVTRMEEPSEEIDLNALLYEVSVLLRKRIQETQAQLHWPPLPTVYSLRSPLRQMLQNLVENALKYISPERSPQIYITVTDLESHWQMAIQDNGLGIESEYFEKIFLIFQRLHRKEEFSGTGIGLAVCKKIVAHLEGKIWVESQFGRGSTFYFTIKK